MLKPHLKISEDGELLIGGISTVQLADEFETPLYVVDENRIRENYRTFRTAFEDHWDAVSIHYAYKANSNLAVCKVLQNEDCGAEVGSLCELKIALKVGVPGKKITFNGNNKTISELELALQENVLINVDSLQELKILNNIAEDLGKKARISFRVNPDVKAPTHPHIATGLRESKFGIDASSGKAIDAYERASKMENVNVEGIHSHIGSQILDADPFVEQAEKLMKIRAQVKKRTGVELETVNLGGGLGIPYEPGEQKLAPADLAPKITSTVEEYTDSSGMSKPMLVFEPGRFIISDTSLLLGRVSYVKKRERTPDWISIDAGMNALIRPALYDSYHHIEVANKMNDEKTVTANVAGPLCESGDFIGKNRKIPHVERGDLLAVYDVGAYGLSMSSQYVGHRRPAMVMVNSGKSEIVRERETCKDLIRLDSIPSWLK